MSYQVRKIVLAGALVQGAYMGATQAVAPTLGLSIQSLHMAAGVLAGTVVGVWSSDRFQSDRRVSIIEATSYGGFAAMLGAVVYFALAALFQLGTVWIENGVFAPLIIGTMLSAIGFAYVALSLFVGFAAAGVSFVAASLF